MDDVVAKILETGITDLEAKVAELTKTRSTTDYREEAVLAYLESLAAPAAEDFEETVTEIRKRDNCSHTDALRKARQVAPAAFAAYRAGPEQADFETLVQTEIAKGCPAAIARQRVGLLNPQAAENVIAKRAAFDDVVEKIMRDEKVTPSVAMSRARRREPDKYVAYQEG